MEGGGWRESAQRRASLDRKPCAAVLSCVLLEAVCGGVQPQSHWRLRCDMIEVRTANIRNGVCVAGFKEVAAKQSKVRLGRSGWVWTMSSCGRCRSCRCRAGAGVKQVPRDDGRLGCREPRLHLTLEMSHSWRVRASATGSGRPVPEVPGSCSGGLRKTGRFMGAVENSREWLVAIPGHHSQVPHAHEQVPSNRQPAPCIQVANLALNRQRS